jgi:hypothetical protein
MSTKSEKILAEIVNGFWIKKNNLMVTDDIISALSTGNSWFESQNQIKFAKEELKPLYSLLDYFAEDVEEYHIENITSEILESCYGVNRAFNSKENKGPLDNNNVFNKVNYDAALEVNNVILDYETYANSNFTGDKYDIFNKIRDVETKNRSILLMIWAELKAAVIKLLEKLLEIINDIILTILVNLYKKKERVRANLSQVAINGLAEFYDEIALVQISAIDIGLNAAKNLIELMIKSSLENLEEFLVTFDSKIEEFVKIWTSIVNSFVQFTKIIGEVWKFAQNFVQSLGITPREKTKIYATVRPQLTEARNNNREIKKQFKSVNENIKSSRKETKLTGQKLILIDGYLKNPNYQDDKLKGLFTPIAASYSAIPTERFAIAPIDLPGKIDVANIIKQIAESILSTFILKGVGIPEGFFEAIKEITAALVLKNLEQTGVDEIKYLVAEILKSAAALLPKVFNELGMFAGAYSMLIACAPYILAAGAIIMLALEYSKRTKLGNFIVIAGYANGQQEPDICCAGVDGEDTMEDIKELINKLIENTLKKYNLLVVTTYHHSYFDKKICRCFDYIEGKFVILSSEQAKMVDTQIRSLDFMY